MRSVEHMKAASLPGLLSPLNNGQRFGVPERLQLESYFYASSKLTAKMSKAETTWLFYN